MPIAFAGRETRRHAGPEDFLACVGDERYLSVQHINELVFVGVPVALG